MHQILKSFFVLCSTIVLLTALFIATSTILSINKIKQEIASENTPSAYNPLQILPPGVHPTPTVTITPDGQFTFSQHTLQGTVLQNCLANASTITNKGNAIIDSVKQKIVLYSAVVLGGENYYTTTLLPGGVKLKNYDELVADLLSKKQATVSSLETLQSDMQNFSCEGQNPSAQLTLYTDDAAQTITALQTYNTSAKNFLTSLNSQSSTQQQSSAGKVLQTNIKGRSNL